MNDKLEVCVDSVRSALEAQKGGAGRVELCSNLVIGGTTPGRALFEQVREQTDLEIRTLIRPRFGDFCYDEYEFEMIKREVVMFRELGADGVVIGILRPDGTLNTEQIKELADLAGDLKVTLHRAFDMSADPMWALEWALETGIDTILTSGQKSSAWEGRELLRQLSEKSAGRIEILAGAGVTPENIAAIHAHTGITSYHMSGKIVKNSRMVYRKEEINMGLPGLSEYEIWQTSAKQVQQAAEILKHL